MKNISSPVKRGDRTSQRSFCTDGNAAQYFVSSLSVATGSLGFLPFYNHAGAALAMLACPCLYSFAPWQGLSASKKPLPRLESSGFDNPFTRGTYLRRRRAAKPASASRESVAVVGSGTVTEILLMPTSLIVNLLASSSHPVIVTAVVYV